MPEAAPGPGGVLRALLKDLPLKAAGFIVTIYGDVVEPRGGVVWIGNLIDTCAQVGISETLVRTAVSRLVAAGQLSGEREGRRSFYRLSEAAQAEFSAAARLLYGRPEPGAWQFTHLAGEAPDEAMQILEKAGHARLGQRLAVGVRPSPPLGQPSVTFRAEVAGGEERLRDFAAAHWDLSPHAHAYRAFIERFSPLLETLPSDAGQCLVARLLLVHQFRLAVLRDPRLPPSALPEHWPGEEARRLFSRLYLALSPQADAHVARGFVTAGGALRDDGPAVSDRFARLRAVG